MAQQIINVGTVANDHTGDQLRAAFVKTKANFVELYALTTVLPNSLRFDSPQSLTGGQKTQVQANAGLVIGTNVQAYNASAAFRTDKLSAFAATSSAELAGVISDETGSGGLVFANSPLLTGVPAAPTAAALTNTTQIATTQFVRTAIADLVSSAPGTLDTLQELATALGDDANFSTTITASLGNRLRFDAVQSLSGGQKTQGQTNLGVLIGTDVQAYHATLAAIAAGIYTGDDSIVTLGTVAAGIWNAGAVTSSGALKSTDTTDASSSITGGGIFAGGIGLAKTLRQAAGQGSYWGGDAGGIHNFYSTNAAANNLIAVQAGITTNGNSVFYVANTTPVTGNLQVMNTVGNTTGDLSFLVQQNGVGSAVFDMLLVGATAANMGAYSRYGVNGGSTWIAGLHKNDSSAYKIGAATDFGGAWFFKITTGGVVYTNVADFILGSKTSITGGATGNVPTLTTGPVTGNPTKWLPYDDNGTIRHLPSW